MIICDDLIAWTLIFIIFLFIICFIIYNFYMWDKLTYLIDLIRKYQIIEKFNDIGEEKKELLEFKPKPTTNDIVERRRKNRERVKKCRERKRTLESN